MQADRFESGSINAANGVVIANTEGISNVGVDIQGTFTGTLVFEASVTGLSWFELSTTPVGPFPQATSTTTPGVWIITPAGFRNIRVRAAAWTSGIAEIVFNGSVSTSALRVIPATAEVAQPVSGPLTDTELRAAPLEVSGSFSVTGGLTDAELRATPVPVSGPATNAELRATPIPVSGTFWQATQPVSAASLPLPSGAATNAGITGVGSKTLTDINSTLGSPLQAGGSVSVSNFPATQTVSGTVTANTGLSQPLTDTQLRATPVSVSATSLPLPTNAATDALQTSGNASLSSIDTKTPALVSGRQPVESVGNVAAGSSSSGNPVKVAGIDETSKVRTLLTDTSGVQQVSIKSPISSFGFPIFSEITPVTQQHFTYGINPKYTKTMTSSGASVTAAGATGNGSDLILAINSAANAFAIAHSFKPLLYRAGVGQIGLFTAAFNTGVASSQQFAGLWSQNAGYFVGYNGTTWGCFARSGGSQSIYSITVTTAATSSANATVTIDGTDVTVALTNQAGNPSRTAWEIAQGVYSTAGSAGTWGWDAYALGAVVYFVARRAKVTAGTFSYSAGTTGSIVTGPTVVRAGSAEVDDFGSPASPGNFTFLDALDGSGPSGLNFNKQKSIIYGVSAGHLGHRGARFFVMHPTTDQLVEFARYNYLNTSTLNLLQNPTLYIAWGIVANGSTIAMTMYAGSGMGGLEGVIDNDEGIPWAVRGAKTATNGVDVHFCSIQNGPVVGFGQTVRAARTKLKVDTIHISVLSASTSQYVDATVIRNPTITNLANFAQVDSTRLAAWAWQDTTTTTATVSGGQAVDRPRVGQGNIGVVDLGIVLEPGEILSVNLKATGAGLICGVSIIGVELQ